jgi:hypothetical protein
MNEHITQKDHLETASGKKKTRLNQKAGHQKLPSVVHVLERFLMVPIV